jgi:hypothetical protein
MKNTELIGEFKVKLQYVRDVLNGKTATPFVVTKDKDTSLSLTES